MILLAVRFSVTFVVLNLLVGCKIMKLNLKSKTLKDVVLTAVYLIFSILFFVSAVKMFNFVESLNLKYFDYFQDQHQ